MSVHVTEQQRATAEAFVAKAQAHGGLAPVDLDRFWTDQAKAQANPWADDCPQVPLGIGMTYECLLGELGLPETPENWDRVQRDQAWQIELAKPYNDRAESLIGRRPLAETRPDPQRAWPGTKGLHDIFEARNEWHGGSWWLQQSADSPSELEALLDRVESRLSNLREFVLPPDWAEAKDRLTALGLKPPLYRGQRGPVTFATSIYGVQNLLFLILDQPELAARLRDLMLRAMLELGRVLDEEAGYTPETAPHGWGWADDNCCLLNPDMYEFFGYPILQGIFERYSPHPGDARGQHSDSDMGHLLPLLGRLELTWANFGPNLTVTEIREHLPRAVIHGQLAPFTFSRHEEVDIVAEFLRDFEMAREHKGLCFATAGSVNNGSQLSGLRLVMAAIQEYGRY